MKKNLSKVAIFVAVLIVVFTVFTIISQDEVIKTLKQSNLELTQENANQSSEIDGYLQQLINKEKEIEELEWKQDNDSTNYSKLEESLNSKIAEYEKIFLSYKQAESELVKLNEEISSLNSLLTSKESQIKLLEAETRADAKEITELKIETAKIQTELDSKQETIQELQNTLDFWLVEYASLDKWNEKLATEAVYKDNEIRCLEIQKEILEREIKKLEEELDSATKLVDRLSKIVDGIHQRIDIYKTHWEYSSYPNTMLATLNVNSLENVNTIHVMYLNEDLNYIRDVESEVSLDKDNGKIFIHFTWLDKMPMAVELSIYYTDGRSEEIVVKIPDAKVNAASISNTWWHYNVDWCGNRVFIARVYFDQLSNVDNIAVEYVDKNQFTVEVENTHIALDKDQKILVIQYTEIDKIVNFVNLIVTYEDGTCEVLSTDTALG